MKNFLLIRHEVDEEGGIVDNACLSTATWPKADLVWSNMGSACAITHADYQPIAPTEKKCKCGYCGRINKRGNDMCLSCGAPIE